MTSTSNSIDKALRESVAELVKKSNHTYSGTPMHTMAGWGFMDVSSDIIALVTNHIKGRMPHKLNPPDGQTPLSMGYNKAISEVNQVLKEMGE